ETALGIRAQVLAALPPRTRPACPERHAGRYGSIPPVSSIFVFVLYTDPLRPRTQPRKEPLPMPLIEKQTKKPDTDVITVRMEKELIAELEAYAEFIDSQKSYIVAQVLATTFGNDTEFQEWRAKNAAPRKGRNQPIRVRALPILTQRDS